MGEDATGHPSRRRVSVDEAARALGLTVDAIRKRVQRGTIPHEKDGAGRVRILLDEGETIRDKGQDTDRPQSDTAALISQMRSHIKDLQTQLEAERQAHSEARTLLLRALERIPPALEPPESPGPSPTPPDAGDEAHAATERPERGEEPPRRSWWREFFGI